MHLSGSRARGRFGRRGNFNSPLSARECSPLSPKGKARGKIGNGMTLLFNILNRKCSSPLIFRNFLSKIFRKSKMGYTPHQSLSATASPRGEALKKARITLFAEENFACKILCRQGGSLGTRLTIFTSLCASTMRQGEATKWLNIFAEENFACKILCRQGEAAKQLTIFASLCASTMRQGEAAKGRY